MYGRCMILSAPSARTPDLTASSGVRSPAPVQAPVDVRRASSPLTGAAGSQPLRRNFGLLILGIVGIATLLIVGLGVVAYLIAGLGPAAFGAGGIMALVPLAIVFFGVRWIDRWEPEPRGILAFAFLWGAAGSVAIALVVGAQIEGVLLALGGSASGGEFLASVVQAPIVEEGAKAFGLLLIFWFARAHFDSPVDGLVYGAWIEGGFAFNENVLYFGVQLKTSGG
ncbi:MAG: PrsW family intrarane metalloprotease, partial [Microbacteriaceae bacterium]|nr:PrsW family intrarane metalloprotease [Microbacteriaceae bacterium]